MIDPNIFAVIGSAAAVASVIAIHEAGHFLAAKWQGMTVSSYNIGYGPKLIAFNDSSQTEFALRAFPLGGYVAFPSNIEVDDEGEITKELDDPNLLQNRPPIQRAIVISAGVIANLLLAITLAAGTSITSGIAHPTFAPGIIVTALPDQNSPAIKAGILPNDVVVSIDKRDIPASMSAVEVFISTVRSSSDRPLDLGVVREGKPITLTVVPRRAPTGKGTIGIAISNRVISVEQVIKENDAYKLWSNQFVCVCECMYTNMVMYLCMYARMYVCIY